MLIRIYTVSGSSYKIDCDDNEVIENMTAFDRDVRNGNVNVKTYVFHTGKKDVTIIAGKHIEAMMS